MNCERHLEDTFDYINQSMDFDIKQNRGYMSGDCKEQPQSTTLSMVEKLLKSTMSIK